MKLRIEVATEMTNANRSRTLLTQLLRFTRTPLGFSITVLVSLLASVACGPEDDPPQNSETGDTSSLSVNQVTEKQKPEPQSTEEEAGEERNSSPDPPAEESSSTTTPEPKRKSLAELARQTRPALLLLETVSEKGDRSIGTGFFVSNDGKLITNWHVVEGAVELVASEVNEDGSRGAEYSEIEILRKNVPGDLALLQAETEPKVFLQVGSPTEIEIGEPIFAFGNPQGLTGTLSEGIVSARRVFEGGYSWVQVTAPISPGSSGSPVVSLDGRVWGVVSWLHKGGQNLNFSSPIEAINDLLEGKNAEDVAPGQLGPVWTLEDERAVKIEMGSFLQNDPSNDEFLKKAQFLARKYPRSISAQEALSYAYYRLGMFEEAEKIAAQLLNSDPENVPALRAISLCAEARHDWALVEQVAKRGLAMDPNDFDMSHGLAFALSNLEKHEEGIRIAERAIRLAEDRLETLPKTDSYDDYDRLVHALFGLHREKACLLWNRAFKIDEGAERDRKRGLLQSLWSKSRVSNRTALEYAETLQDQSHTQSFRKTTDSAISEIWISEIWYDIARASLELGEVEECLKSCKQAIQIDPSNARAMVWAAEAYMFLENRPYAFESLKRAYETAHTHGDDWSLEAARLRLEAWFPGRRY